MGIKNNMEKQFIQLQLALFFKADFSGKIEDASLAIKEKFGSDMGTQILNVPSVAPSEIPRLILTSKEVNINLSKNRIDFFAKNKSFSNDNVKNIFDILNKLKIEIVRVGFVLTFFKESDLSDIKSLLNNAKTDLINLKDITVRLNKEEDIEGFKSNNSQMYVSGSVKDNDGLSKNGVIITRDINSLISDIDKNNFTEGKLEDFLKKALELAEISLI